MGADTHTTSNWSRPIVSMGPEGLNQHYMGSSKEWIPGFPKSFLALPWRMTSSCCATPPKAVRISSAGSKPVPSQGSADKPDRRADAQPGEDIANEPINRMARAARQIA